MVRMQENQNPRALMAKNAHWNATTLLNSLDISPNVKSRVTMQPSNLTSRLFTQEKWKLYLHKNLFMNVQRCIIHSSENIETTQMLINWWRDKSNLAYAYDEMLFSSKKKKSNADICNYINEPWKYAIENIIQIRQHII